MSGPSGGRVERAALRAGAANAESETGGLALHAQADPADAWSRYRSARPPLRVVHLIETLGSGGAERLLHTNLQHLDRERFHSTVLTVYSHGDYWAEPIRRLGVRVEGLGCRGYRDLPALVFRLARWLRKERPDLLHTHLWAANVGGRVAGRLTGVPVVSSVHDSDYEPERWEASPGVGPLQRRLVWGLDRLTARLGCVRIVAVSEYVRQSVHRRLGFPLARTVLVYNPIDTGELEGSSSRPRAELLRELGVPEEAPVLLNVGRVTPQKGLLCAVRALPAVLKRHPEGRLISVGSVEDRLYMERLEAEARALGIRDRVHILGPRRDIPDLLRACDLFLFPSIHEGLGIALIEAMAAGCACIASHTGPIPEVVRHGTDGWLAPPGEPEAWARAISELLADPERRVALGGTARESALARFEPRAAAEQLGAVYGEVVRSEE